MAGQGEAPIQVHYCRTCGAEVGDARFCPGCGNPVGAEQPTPGPWLGADPATPAQPSAEKHQRSIVPWLAGAALGLAVIAVVAVVLLSSSGSSSSSSTSSAYSQKLAAALSPLITANQQLSSSLTALTTSSSASSAQTAVQQDQSALTSAQGAIGILTVPSSSIQLSQSAKQALAEESGYLQAVSGILGSPTAAAATQLQPLASSTTAALVPLDATVANASNSIGGTNNLVLWAQSQASKAQKARFNAIAHSQSQSASATSGNSSASASTNCGGGLIAGPDTSCPFAQQVENAYEQAPGASTGAAATVEAYSPVTGQTYAMSCAPAGSGVTCNGGNNASVTFP